MKTLKLIGMTLIAFMLSSCNNNKKQKDQPAVTFETIKHIAEMQQEERMAVFKRNFDIDGAKLWLKNKIINSYRGLDTKTWEEKSLIKTINVRFCDTNLEECKFIAEGVTTSDMAFKYSFIIRKINGYYCVDRTDAPNNFYNK